ncbi:MAG: 5-amino-6-(5-phosphoribosylamino)uracil reductase [Pseudonocardiales bacterium]|nr:MAG: 5-amino-6-(5-phosphoribosylamino)uracil reductase [Pseudonocardiales bacterium]
MGAVTCQIAMSLDGFVAGPNQSLDNPIGEGGMRLHEWVFADDKPAADAQVVEGLLDGNGAYIMGRKMFGGGGGEWDESWHGWWGDDPPYHVPTFVLTHQARDSLPMKGGTTFHFVTDGIESALEQARAAAGDGNVCIAGGASAVQQYLAAGLLDEIYIHIVPLVLGQGERLFDNVADQVLEPIDVIASPAVTHVRYRVVH